MRLGSCAGIVEHCCMFPLDTIKTHMQASRGKLGFFEASKTLLKEEGALRMWKGSHVMALGCIPSHASYFLAYENLKLWLSLNNEEYDI